MSNLKLLAVVGGTLATWAGYYLSQERPASLTVNKHVDVIFKNLHPNLKDGCNRFLPQVIYTSRDPSLIDQAILDCPNINKKFSQIQLTALHLAAISGNDYAMDALHEKEANLDRVDSQGATALHHAAMVGNTAGVQKLLAWGATPTIRLKNGATFMDILRFTEPFRSSPFTLDKTLFSAHTNDTYTVDKECLALGVKWIHENVITPKTYIRDHWAREPGSLEKNEAILKLLAFRTEKYEQYKRNPPKLSIAIIQEDDQGNSLAAPFCGVIAEEPIKKREVITECLGELFPEKEIPFRDNAHIYQDFPPIDTAYYRSPSAMVADGFPNANYEQHFTPKGMDGFPERRFIVATEDIAKGEQIVINYGGQHEVKKKGHIEMRPKAIDAFLSKYSWKNLLDASSSFLDPTISIEQRLEVTDMFAKFEYLLVTPSTLADLAEKGLITRKDMKTIEKTLANSPIEPLQVAAKLAMAHIAPIVKQKSKQTQRKEEV